MLQQFLGCMYGAAIGDALGAPIEFLSYQRIRKIYGEKGICDFQEWNGFPAGSYTDDFQMTLHTANGILNCIRNKYKKPLHLYIYESYLEWLHTQSDSKENRFPGETCIKSLESMECGTVETPINDRKGAGGLMRVSPIGLMYPSTVAFMDGMNVAAITHGHPSGYLSAGFLASLISFIVEGNTLEKSIELSVNKLIQYEGHEEVFHKILEAVKHSEIDMNPIEAIHRIGEGWVSEEALAISLYCVLKKQNNFEECVLLSINHNGDSDTTGCITGAIIGTLLGFDSIPERWVRQIENSEKIKTIAMDLYKVKNQLL